MERMLASVMLALTVLCVATLLNACVGLPVDKFCAVARCPEACDAKAGKCVPFPEDEPDEG